MISGERKSILMYFQKHVRWKDWLNDFSPNLFFRKDPSERKKRLAYKSSFFRKKFCLTKVLFSEKKFCSQKVLFSKVCRRGGASTPLPPSAPVPFRRPRADKLSKKNFCEHNFFFWKKTLLNINFFFWKQTFMSQPFFPLTGIFAKKRFGEHCIHILFTLN